MEQFPDHLLEYIATFFDDKTLQLFLRTNRYWYSKSFGVWKAKFEGIGSNVYVIYSLQQRGQVISLQMSMS